MWYRAGWFERGQQAASFRTDVGRNRRRSVLFGSDEETGFDLNPSCYRGSWLVSPAIDVDDISRRYVPFAESVATVGWPPPIGF